MRRVIALSALLLTSTAVEAAEVMSIEDYLAVARGQNPNVNAAELDNYLAGVLDGVISMGEVVQSQGNPLFCLPDDPGGRITVDNFKQAIDELLAQLERDLPDFTERSRRSTMGRAAIQLFLFRFPCGEGQGG